MKELDIQTLIINAGNDLGGHCFKCNNRFLKGVSDLSIQLPRRPHCYVEVKFCKRFKRGMRATFDLTINQRDFMIRHRKAGGNAGWVMVVADKNGRYLLDCSPFVPSMHVRNLIYDDHWFAKERGEPWPVKRIVDVILNAKPREYPELGGAPRRVSNGSSTIIPTLPTAPARARPSRGATKGRPSEW